MDTRSLECFVAVSTFGTLRAAARALNLTQPALTTRIHRLEDQLGFALFARSRRGVTLTEHGRLFLPQARQAVAALRRTRDGAAAIRAGGAGTLRLGYTALGALGCVPALIRAFQAERPSVRLEVQEITSGPIETALAGGDLDAGVLHPPIATAGLALHDLLTVGFKVTLPAGHALAARSRLALADLRDERFILVARAIGPHAFDQMVSRCLAAGFHPHIVQEVQTSISVLGMVAAGMGIGLVVEPLSRFRHPDLVFIDLDEPTAGLTFSLAWCQDRDNPLVAALHATAQRIFAASPVT